MESMLLDVAGHRRSPATMPGYHRGRPPRNKGEQYAADPPTVEEIVAVMRTIGDRAEGHRLRALIVLLWRAGLRISEALALQESDLDRAITRDAECAGSATQRYALTGLQAAEPRRARNPRIPRPSAPKAGMPVRKRKQGWEESSAAGAAGSPVLRGVRRRRRLRGALVPSVKWRVVLPVPRFA